MSSDFTYERDSDGVVILRWDCPGRSMNVMGLEGLNRLSQLIAQAQADPAVRGVVLTSGKGDFAGGMDLAVIAGLREGGARAIFDGVMAIHALLRRIEIGQAAQAAQPGLPAQPALPAKPVAAALPGTALGIGLELALACHRIFAADSPRARIGLPEIRLGLFPGAGGTTRLLRRLGAMAAAPFLLEGKLLPPAAAARAGLIDVLTPPETLLEQARAWVLQAKPEDLIKPWDRKGASLPGGGPYSPAGFMTFLGAAAMVSGRSQGAYPAPQALLQAAYEGALVPFDTALRIEARWFTHVLLDPSSQAMIRSLFLNKEALEKGANRPAAIAPRPVARLGVLGAGMMGAGIARVAAQAGIAVRLLDQTPEAAAAGLGRIAAALDTERARGKLTPEAAQALLAQITPGADPAQLADCDLVIEAVFEEPGLKKAVLARAAAALGPEACLASNTSTLPITELAQACPHPDRMLGLHFFSPVEKMQLVEVIRTPATSAASLAQAMDFVRQIRKVPILVTDARFFYANRCILPYVNEGLRLLAEGCPAALIENAARMAGMPLGPLQLIDETSIALGLSIAQATRAAQGPAYGDALPESVLQAMAGRNRLGRKAGAGFYDYDGPGGRRLGLWAGLADLWPPQLPPGPEGARTGLIAVQNRLLLIQALEALRAYEQGVLLDIREGDVGAILGWGFAPWSGGPFSWIDRLGAGPALALARDLAARHGPRFTPPALLARMAQEGGRFYP